MVQSPRTILQVVADPDILGLRSKTVLAFIGAVHIARQGVVKFGALNDDFKGDVVGPIQNQNLRPTVRNRIPSLGCGERRQITYHSRPNIPAKKFSADFIMRSWVYISLVSTQLYNLSSRTAK